MNHDQLARVAVFAEIVEAGSLTAAALRLGVVKSSLSERLAELERAVGAKLLERSRAGVRPTEAGLRLLPHAQAIVRESRAAGAALREAEAPSGSLRISIPAGIADPVLLPALAGFLGSYPGISLDVLATDEVLDLDRARIDLAVRLGFVEDGRFVARVLRRAERLVVASPAYLARSGPLRGPADLAAHDWIGFAGFGLAPTLRFTALDGTVAEVTLSCRVHTSAAATLKAWVLAGAGVAHLPSVVLASELEDGRLIRVLPEWKLAGPTLYAIYRPERLRPANVRRLIDHLAAAFRT